MTQLNKMCWAALMALPVGWSSAAWAGADAAQPASASAIIVTATGFAQDRDESGQAITLIDSATIARAQALSLADLLAFTPSVRTSSNGALGSVTSISLRGAEAGQTLVLLDGVRINDPSSPNDAVDFGNLLTANIHRVEVMRGANSVPYGSDAIGGVINLSTHDPDAPDGLNARASAQGGYVGTLDGSADLGWRSGARRVDVGISALHTNGISSADRALGATESDGLRNFTGHASVTMPLGDGVSLDLRGYAIDAKLATDSFFGVPADSADTSHFRQLIGYAGLNALSFSGRLKSVLAFTWLGNRRDYRPDPDADPQYGYRGWNWRLQYRGLFRLTPAARLVFGYDHDAPRYRYYGFGSDERHSAQVNSFYGMLVLQPLARLTLTGGARHDVHSQFGGVTTFGANANYGLGDGKTRLRAAYGEGFRAPSLYQLYDGYSGNADLVPERSRSFDVGVDRRFANGHGTVSLSLFTRATRHQIDYDLTTYRYANLDRTRAQGVELSVDVKPVRSLDLALAYSLVDTRDRSPGSATYDQHLARRPVSAISASADQLWALGLSTGVTLRMVGKSLDPTAPSGELPGYILVGLRASLPVTARLALFGRIDNLTDAGYETAYGYGTYGRSAYGGVRVRF